MGYRFELIDRRSRKEDEVLTVVNIITGSLIVLLGIFPKVFAQQSGSPVKRVILDPDHVVLHLERYGEIVTATGCEWVRGGRQGKKGGGNGLFD